MGSASFIHLLVPAMLAETIGGLHHLLNMRNKQSRTVAVPRRLHHPSKSGRHAQMKMPFMRLTCWTTDLRPLQLSHLTRSSSTQTSKIRIISTKNRQILARKVQGHWVQLYLITKKTRIIESKRTAKSS